MHTVEELDPTDFVYRSDGEVVSRDELLPRMTPDQRVGVVMADGTDGIGAGNFVLSSVVAFYEAVAESRDDFFEYPDYSASGPGWHDSIAGDRRDHPAECTAPDRSLLSLRPGRPAR